jgi:DNA-binding MarR family transcriptional regulator
MARGRSNQPAPVQGTAKAAAVTDAVVTASRLLVAVSARSIALADESITLPQFRLLVLISSRGAMNLSALTEHLGILPSTGTRMVDRLVAAGLVDRQVNPASRREIVVGLTEDGAAIVAKATLRRRREIAQIVARMPERSQQDLVTVLEQFNEAGGEPPASNDVPIDTDWF